MFQAESYGRDRSASSTGICRVSEGGDMTFRRIWRLPVASSPSENRNPRYGGARDLA